jgi:hypothetical protein
MLVMPRPSGSFAGDPVKRRVDIGFEIQQQRRVRGRRTSFERLT